MRVQSIVPGQEATFGPETTFGLKTTFGLETTLRRSVSLHGTGVHGNRPCRIILHPADAGCGIVFHRYGGGADVFIPALWTQVGRSRLATTLTSADRPAIVVSGVEHVLAALRGCGVDNATVEVDGPELPMLDGSARPFVLAIRNARLRRQSRPRRAIEVLKPVRVEAGEGFAEFRPAARPGLWLDVSIDYADPAVGRQRRRAKLDASAFRQIAPARTFGFTADAERLWRQGFALGTSFENTIVVSDGRVLNPGGLRNPDEFVRHKMLDAIGDLALAGAHLHGAFRSHRGGHALNVAALRALLSDRSAWRYRGQAQARHAPARPSAAAPRD